MSTTALLILLAGALIVSELQRTSAVYEQQAERLRDAQLASLRQLGVSTVRGLSDTIGPLLLEGDLALVNDAVRRVAKSGESITRVAVIGTDFRILASDGQDKLGDSVAESMRKALESLAAQPVELSGKELPVDQGAVAFGNRVELASRPLGHLLVEISTQEIDAQIEQIFEEQEKARSRALGNTLLLATPVVLIGLVTAILLGLRFSGNIRALTRVAEQVGQGDLSVRAERRTNDEVGVLAAQFNEMTQRVSSLLEESVAKAAIDREVAQARAIQEMLMPARKEFERPGIRYYRVTEAATDIGGDWWQHYRIENEKTLLCVGDVTGHGIPSAMLTATAKACCDTMVRQGFGEDLTRFLGALNHAIREAGQGRLVMTMFVVLWDPATRVLSFSNAGHNFPMLRAGGKLKAL
ncbi:MAG: SpoIIE family protein phosphatase, partial [Myxococcota bacterium]